MRHQLIISTSDRIIRLLVEEGELPVDGLPRQEVKLTRTGLNHLPVVPKTVRTPVGMEYEGVSFQGRICGVSIMRGELDFAVNCRCHQADMHSGRGVPKPLGTFSCTV